MGARARDMHAAADRTGITPADVRSQGPEDPWNLRCSALWISRLGLESFLAEASWHLGWCPAVTPLTGNQDTRGSAAAAAAAAAGGRRNDVAGARFTCDMLC